MEEQYTEQEEGEKAGDLAEDLAQEVHAIAEYSRGQAIRDGVLVDVSEIARECGFRYPVAVTARVWSEVLTPDRQARLDGQCKAGRLWDVLGMLRAAIRHTTGAAGVLTYKVFVRIGGKFQERILKAVCGPGDKGEPVITVMMLEED